MVEQGGVLGAVRERLLSSAVVKKALPGGCHANELVADAGLSYPAAVLRLPRSEFKWYGVGPSPQGPAPVRREWIERPRVEVWVEALDAFDGEAVARLCAARLTDQPLPWAGGETIQVYPVDLFLHPETSRAASGKRQYSWCAAFELWLGVTGPVAGQA